MRMRNKKHPRPGDDPSHLSLVGVWLGGKRLLGIAPSWNAVAERLEGYSLFQVLEVSGRIDGLLRAQFGHDLEVQFQIVRGLFKATTADAIVRRVGLAIARERDGRTQEFRPVLFGTTTLNTLSQVAVHVCEPRSETLRADLQGIGEALLILADMTEEPGFDPSGFDFETSDGRRRWVFYTTIAGAAPGTDPAVNSVARAYQLFLTSHASLKNRSSYIALDELFVEATGLTQREYALAVLGLLGFGYGITPGNVGNQKALIKLDMVGEGNTLPKGIIEKMFGMAGLESTAFAQEMRENAPAGQLLPLRRVAVERSPVVRFQTMAAIQSIQHLQRRMTDGLYHVLLNARQGSTSSAFRAQFQRFMGDVFSEYVSRAMERIVAFETERNAGGKRNLRIAPRFISEAELLAATSERTGPSPSLCDGALLVGRHLILLEFKAKMFSLAARTGEDLDAFFSKLDEIAVYSARQLDSSIKLLTEGAFASLGLAVDKIDAIHPMTVSLQQIPMNPALHRYIAERLRAEGLLQTTKAGRSRILGLTLMDASDLDMLELAVETGSSLPSLLSEKARSRFGISQSIGTWMAMTGRLSKLPRKHPSFHDAVYDSLTDQAIALFREHQT